MCHWTYPMLTSSIYFLFGRQIEFFAESMLSYLECKEIAFAFIFVNRKCNFLLFCDDTIAQNAHHNLSLLRALCLVQSRSHVNVPTKLKSTMNWWDNPVEISMHKWKCRHARPFTGWTRLNARDKLCNPLVANRTDTCSSARYSSTWMRIRDFSILRPHIRTNFSAFVATTHDGPQTLGDEKSAGRKTRFHYSEIWVCDQKHKTDLAEVSLSSEWEEKM